MYMTKTLKKLKEFVTYERAQLTQLEIQLIGKNVAATESHVQRWSICAVLDPL